MSNTHGSLSINSDNIFPIIKKWMYSDHDIFYRELISNGCDAITKLKKLDMIGEYEAPDDIEYKIDVKVSANNKTIKIIDNGIGMTDGEVEEYINQIAFSGAEAFLEKYKDKANDDQIIGHFGLGFYSAFMVADKVTIDTLSFKEGAKAVHWECDGGTEYDMSDGTAATPGTTITLYLNEDSYEFANEYKAREVVEKYCSFMPVPIFLTNEDAGEQTEEIPEEEVTDKDTVLDTFIKEAVTEEVEKEDGTKETVEKVPAKKMAKIVKRPVAINDIHPLWTKHPNECTEDEYKEFYRKVFNDWKEPLFHIHIKADYPLNFKGILYFPRIGSEFESLEGQVKLYYNQVFVADNIKEVIPEYLLMLKGVLDCPELPLNVSRSYLQNSGYVAKISAHITKKVADKLNSMFSSDRKSYEGIWRDLKTFVEYGCMRDRKFYDKVSPSILFETTDGEFKTVDEYLEAAKEKHENKIYYASDVTAQSKYVKMFKDEGIEVVLLDRVIDTQFINTIESNREGVKFIRIDSEIADVLKADGDKTEIPAVTELFKKVAGEHTTVTFERLKDEKTPAILNLSEEARRMNDMMKLYKMGSDMPVEQTLIVNTASPLIEKLTKLTEESKNDEAELIARQIYMLASLSQRQLTSDELLAFLGESYDILGKL